MTMAVMNGIKPLILLLLVLLGTCLAKMSKHHILETSSHRFVVDLTHPLVADSMPVTEGGSPLEVMKENRDQGHGAR